MSMKFGNLETSCAFPLLANFWKGKEEHFTSGACKIWQSAAVNLSRFHVWSKLCHLKLQQKLHYRNLVQSLKITSLIFWVNITYNAYCYSTINALALMLMLMFSVYLNNFPQHKKRSESISVMYVSLSDFSLPLNAQMHVPSPYVLVLRVWVGHPISSKREKEDLTRLYGNMNLNIIYPSVPHNHSVYVSGLKW